MKNYKVILAAYQAMLNNTSDMIFLKNAKLQYVTASQSFVNMVGKKSVKEIVNKTDLEIFADKSLAERYIADDHKLIESGKDLIDYTEPITDMEGQHRYGTTSKYLLKDEKGEFIGILGFTRDITKDYFARQHYQQELKYLFGLPSDTYAVSYIDVDDWRIVSQRRQQIEGSSFQSCFTVEALVKAAMDSIVDYTCEAAEFFRHFTPAVLRDIHSSGRRRLTFKYQRIMTNDDVRWVRIDIRFLTDIDSGHLCAMLSGKDIDAQLKEEQRLIFAARMDKMTMLLNRETTMEQIKQILQIDADKKHSLFMLDVDNFKALNDTRGHQAGDEFLVTLAAEIKKHFRDTDIVGRIGGDEFFALMRNIPGEKEATAKAQELLTAMQIVCGGYSSIQLSASIGVSLYPKDAQTMDELYAKADDALYQAKGKGKNQVVFYGE